MKVSGVCLHVTRVLLLFISILLTPTAFAQSTGSISGQVQNATGALIPGADVTARNTATNLSYNTLSNELGSFEFSSMQIGSYEVTVKFEGFKTDFYKVAVSSAGCHDNRMDKISWNEQWMGWPLGPHYAASSNVDHAHNLQGKLLLIVGELDTNVDPASTMQVANALIKAGKKVDLLVIPGADHTSGGAYGNRLRNDFFVHHLLGLEPPDWNRAPATQTSQSGGVRN